MGGAKEYCEDVIGTVWRYSLLSSSVFPVPWPALMSLLLTHLNFRKPGGFQKYRQNLHSCLQKFTISTQAHAAAH